jgi:bifunctional non-homologous end joining protein LigD
MLAVSGARPSHGRWAYEVKWDGIRVVVGVEDGALHLVTRNANDVTHRYPELVGLPAALDGHDAVLDGEVVAFDMHGRPSFQLLQRRMHVEGRHDIERLAAEVPVTLMLFDVLALDRKSLLDRPYLERRAVLQSLGLDGDAWRTPPHEEGDGSTLWEWSRDHGMEGVVAKRVDSVYRPGRRSPDWVKVKHQRRQELVVGGFTPGEGARAATFGSLLLGYHDRSGALRYAGRVGTGFDERSLTDLVAVLRRLERPASPFDGGGAVPRGAHFVEPVLVVEVRFAQWTEAGILRAPVFLGVRTDIDAADVVREP